MNKDDDIRPLNQEELAELDALLDNGNRPLTKEELAALDAASNNGISTNTSKTAPETSEPINFNLPPVPNKTQTAPIPKAIPITTLEDATSQKEGIDAEAIAQKLVEEHINPLLSEYEAHQKKEMDFTIENIIFKMENMTQAMVDEKIITQEQRDKYIKPSKSWGEFFTFSEGTGPSKLKNDIKSSLKFDKDSNLKYQEVHLFKDKVKKMVSAICSYLCPSLAQKLLNSIDDPTLKKKHNIENDLSGLVTKVEKGIKRKAKKVPSKEVGSKVKNVLAERQKKELTESRKR